MTDQPPTHPAGHDEVEATTRRLAAAGQPFVRATVVRREPPVSATVGDRAIVTDDGTIHGWIGGVECAQSAVVREAREALATGEARFIGLAPEPAEVDRPGLVALPMTCHGGGTLEVFLEPVGPATELMVVGTSPVASAIVRVADELGLAVTVVDPAGGTHEHAETVVRSADPSAIGDVFDRPPLAVVASMGEADVAGIVAAVGLDAPYIGLVANRRRAGDVIDRAADQLGVERAAIEAAVTVPAGIDIDARTPAEIGVSVAGELVMVRRDYIAGADRATEPSADHEPARDPVCGMTVDMTAPAATVEFGGEAYVFCSVGCAEAFESTPERYLADA